LLYLFLLSTAVTQILIQIKSVMTCARIQMFKNDSKYSYTYRKSSNWPVNSSVVLAVVGVQVPTVVPMK